MLGYVFVDHAVSVLLFIAMVVILCRLEYVSVSFHIPLQTLLYLKLQNPVPVSGSNCRLILPPVTGLSSISAVYNTVIDLICPAETQCLSPSLYEKTPCV